MHWTKRLRNSLNENSGRWYDMNIPTSDGQLLYDIIVKNNYKSALKLEPQQAIQSLDCLGSE